MSKQHVFISYLHDDERKAKRLRDLLEKAGEPVWMDDRILGGMVWEHEIRAAIEDAYAFVVCLSSSLAKRIASGVFPELAKAVEIYRQLAPGKIFVIPVRLDECEVPVVAIDSTKDLRSLQYIDLFPRLEVGLSKVLDSIRASALYPVIKEDTGPTPSREVRDLDEDGEGKSPGKKQTSEPSTPSVIQTWVLERVTEQFEKLASKELTQRLRDLLKKQGSAPSRLADRKMLVSEWVSMKPPKAIASLRASMVFAYEPAKVPAKQIQKVWDVAETIMGLLVLLSVDDTWADDMSKSLDDETLCLRFDLPASTLMGAEVGRARLRSEPALLCGETDQLPVRGKHGYPVLLEGGPLPNDWVRDIKKDLFGRLRDDIPPPSFSEKKDDINLDHLLFERALEDKAPYAIIKFPRDEEKWSLGASIRDQLEQELPNLGMLILDTGAQQTIISMEEKLQSAVSLFFADRKRVESECND